MYTFSKCLSIQVHVHFRKITVQSKPMETKENFTHEIGDVSGKRKEGWHCNKHLKRSVEGVKGTLSIDNIHEPCRLHVLMCG